MRRRTVFRFLLPCRCCGGPFGEALGNVEKDFPSLKLAAARIREQCLLLATSTYRSVVIKKTNVLKLYVYEPYISIFSDHMAI